MHECPDCGQACDCDGEDTWFDDLNTYLNCSHECEEFDEDFEDYLIFDEEDRQALSQKLSDAEQAVGAVGAGPSEDDGDKTAVTPDGAKGVR